MAILGGMGAAVLLFAGALVMSAVRWWLVLGPGLVPLGWLVRLYFIGQFFSLFLPTSVGGDAVRIVALSRGGVTTGRALSSVIIERMLGVGALLLYLVLGGLMAPALVSPLLQRLSWALGWRPALVLVITGGLALGLLAMRVKRWVRFNQLLHDAGGVWERLRVSRLRVATAVCASLIVQAMYVLMWYLLAVSLDLGHASSDHLRSGCAGGGLDAAAAAARHLLGPRHRLQPPLLCRQPHHRSLGRRYLHGARRRRRTRGLSRCMSRPAMRYPPSEPVALVARSSASSRWAPGAILLLAAALRLVGLRSNSFFQDELYTVEEATNLFHSTAQPGIWARPFYYVVQHMLLALAPPTPLALRLLPFVLGVLGVWLTWLVGKRVLGEVAGLVAAFLLAITPWHLFVSGMARYWSLVYVLAALGYLALHQAEQLGRTRD